MVKIRQRIRGMFASSVKTETSGS